MELDELKSNWKESGQEIKTLAELQKMTKIRNHPKLRRIRVKLIIEVLLLIMLIVFYNNIFDGNDKPIWANMVLLISALLFILNDVNGYLVTRSPIKANSLKLSIDRLSKKLEQVSVWSVSSMLIFGSALILFFTSSIDFTIEKYLILGGMIITLMVMGYVSHRNWRIRIKHFQKVSEEFEE